MKSSRCFEGPVGGRRLSPACHRTPKDGVGSSTTQNDEGAGQEVRGDTACDVIRRSTVTTDQKVGGSSPSERARYFRRNTGRKPFRRKGFRPFQHSGDDGFCTEAIVPKCLTEGPGDSHVTATTLVPRLIDQARPPALPPCLVSGQHDAAGEGPRLDQVQVCRRSVSAWRQPSMRRLRVAWSSRPEDGDVLLSGFVWLDQA
jgi:hypothetical protein